MEFPPPSRAAGIPSALQPFDSQSAGPGERQATRGERFERPLQFPELAARACWTLAVGAFDSISTFFS